MNFQKSDNDRSNMDMQNTCPESEAQQEQRELAEKFRSRPKVRRYKQCAQELHTHKDFSDISPAGIELAARYIKEVFKTPNAVLIKAHWVGDSLIVDYAEQEQGAEVEGLFKDLPAYAEGPIVEDSIFFAEIEFDPPEEPCSEELTALGYPIASAYEIENLLGGETNVRMAMREGLERAIQDTAYGPEPTAFPYW